MNFAKAATLSALVFSAVISPQANANLCATAFNPVPKEMQWRELVTNPTASGTYASTSAKRETDIKKAARTMERDVLDEATPIMELFSAVGTREFPLVQTGGYGTGEITKIQLSNLGPSGIYRGTLLLPVSGHDGAASARRWAKTDTYSIVLHHNGSQKNIVNSVPSKDIVTVQEIEVPMVKNEVVKISYERSGSAGSGGFREGRIIEFLWDGT